MVGKETGLVDATMVELALHVTNGSTQESEPHTVPVELTLLA